MNTLHQKIENSKPVDFGAIFSKSIELFKKVWSEGLVHVLLGIAIMFPLFIIIYVLITVLGIGGSFLGIFAAEGFSQGDAAQNELIMGGVSIGIAVLSFVAFFFLLMLIVGIQFGITAHFYRVCKHVDLGVSERTSYFMFLKGKYLKKIMVLAMVMSAVVFVSILFFYLPFFYVMVPLQLMGVIFAFNPELSVTDLIKSSLNLGNKLWLTAFGLIILSSMLAQTIGMGMCCIGIFATASFVHVPIYYLYKDAIGFDDEDSRADFDEISLIES